MSQKIKFVKYSDLFLKLNILSDEYDERSKVKVGVEKSSKLMPYISCSIWVESKNVLLFSKFFTNLTPSKYISLGNLTLLKPQYSSFSKSKKVGYPCTSTP